MPVLLIKDPADQDYLRVPAPVSFSSACAAALRIIAAIAHGAPVHAFDAAPAPFWGTTGGAARVTVLDLPSEAEGDTQIATLDPTIKPPRVKIISAGRIEIMNRMAAKSPDLVVVGAHTRSGFAPAW